MMEPRYPVGRNLKSLPTSSPPVVGLATRLAELTRRPADLVRRLATPSFAGLRTRLSGLVNRVSRRPTRPEAPRAPSMASPTPDRATSATSPTSPTSVTSTTGSTSATSPKGAIRGAHIILFSKDSEADRNFFRDVLQAPFVDAGHGWLIFALPPAEVAVHPADDNDRHELYLMCDDVHGFVTEMRGKDVDCAEVHEERWGSLTKVALPGGGTIGVYQPKHPSPAALSSPNVRPDSQAKPKPSRKKVAKVRPKKKATKRPV